MIDRLVRHAEILALKGDSYRLRDRISGALARTPDRQHPFRYALRARLHGCRDHRRRG